MVMCSTKNKISRVTGTVQCVLFFIFSAVSRLPLVLIKMQVALSVLGWCTHGLWCINDMYSIANLNSYTCTFILIENLICLQIV